MRDSEGLCVLHQLSAQRLFQKFTAEIRPLKKKKVQGRHHLEFTYQQAVDTNPFTRLSELASELEVSRGTVSHERCGTNPYERSEDSSVQFCRQQGSNSRLSYLKFVPADLPNRALLSKPAETKVMVLNNHVLTN